MTAFGTGHAYGSPARAALLAAAEAIERLAMLTVDPARIRVASAKSLGESALDFDRIPRCSARELRTPGCPVRPADKTRPIRWVEGINVDSGLSAYLPAVMTYMGMPQAPDELFWTPVSTGCAAHQTVAEAAVSALCEVIERDAVALTWLQRLPLPPLAEKCLTDQAREMIEWCRHRDISTYLFDATTDLGVPVVYCLQTSDGTDDGSASQLVGCACAFDPLEAAEHAVMETLAIRRGFSRRRRRPRRYRDFTSITDGAAVMGVRSHRSAFQFLLDAAAKLEPQAPPDLSSIAPGERLPFLIGRLASAGARVYATDLSTREVRDAGLVVLRVLVPELQPLPTRALAQYRAHPRLYTAPAMLGMRVLPCSRLNPYPQPMA